MLNLQKLFIVFNNLYWQNLCSLIFVANFFKNIFLKLKSFSYGEVFGQKINKIDMKIYLPIPTNIFKRHRIWSDINNVGNSFLVQHS